MQPILYYVHDPMCSWCYGFEATRQERGLGVQIIAVENTPGAVEIHDWVPRFPVCVVFGNEDEAAIGVFGKGD